MWSHGSGGLLRKVTATVVLEVTWTPCSDSPPSTLPSQVQPAVFSIIPLPIPQHSHFYPVLVATAACIAVTQNAVYAPLM